MSRHNCRFIIADDDPDVRSFVSSIILRLYPDAMIGEAGTGEEALELFEAGGVDLMIIDYKMPLINGTELIRELRAQQVAIPLVVISNLPQAKEEAMKAGATFFLDKSRLSPDLGYYLPAMLPEK